MNSNLRSVNFETTFHLENETPRYDCFTILFTRKRIKNCKNLTCVTTRAAKKTDIFNYFYFNFIQFSCCFSKIRHTFSLITNNDFFIKLGEIDHLIDEFLHEIRVKRRIFVVKICSRVAQLVSHFEKVWNLTKK